jgi:uncharacterized membrane protein YfcA
VADPLIAFLPLALLAFVCEYVDSALGMGYGTTLTPLLLILGFQPLQIVPAILVSEFATGLAAGIMHHELGNVNLRPGGHDFKVAGVLAACSVVGTVVAVIAAVKLPPTIVKGYIAILVLSMGIFVLATLGRSFRFTWPKLVGLGTVAAFNKGISGGGYGPLVTGGQIVAGVQAKAAVGITSLAESLTCLVGIIAYLLTSDQGIDWKIAGTMALGALLSVPLAGLTVKKLPDRIMRMAVGVAVVLLGCWSLYNLMRG